MPLVNKGLAAWSRESLFILAPRSDTILTHARIACSKERARNHFPALGGRPPPQSILPHQAAGLPGEGAWGRRPKAKPRDTWPWLPVWGASPAGGRLEPSHNERTCKSASCFRRVPEVGKAVSGPPACTLKSFPLGRLRLPLGGIGRLGLVEDGVGRDLGLGRLQCLDRIEELLGGPQHVFDLG